MASVTSLDKDMRKLRLDRYTPQAANDVRTFVENALGERLSQADLLDSLKDGVALCKLVNLAVPNCVRFKTKAVMPFVQMENISLFLNACKSAPFNLQSHDMFLTVDLYESKDPAQVLQCLGAFSRAAHKIDPARFPTPIGGRSRGGVLSPQGTGTAPAQYGSRAREVSNASTNSSTYNPGVKPVLTPTRTGDSTPGRWSPTKTGKPLSPGVSSWSNKSDEGNTAPAWNISQYGYMGGASQGNLGVAFGGRRQITSAGPHVPSLAEKEKRRREQAAEEERQRLEAEVAEQQRREEQEAEEERARAAEEQRWADETRRLRDQERLKAEDEKRKWEEDERRWKIEDERRQAEEREVEARLQDERKRQRGNSDAKLRGQFLSQYQAENGAKGNSQSSRIQELERELELAREREREYERERQAKLSATSNSRSRMEERDPPPRAREASKVRNRSRSRPRAASPPNLDEAWREDERQYLQKQWQSQDAAPPAQPPRPLPETAPRISKQPTGGARPLPEPTRIQKQHTGGRPLPDPSKYASAKAEASTHTPNQNRTDRYLASNPAPATPKATTTYSNEIGGFDSAAERDAEDRRRAQSQTKTKAGGWASKSLLEREMEMERQRQQEWEESQKELKNKVPSGNGVDGVGGGIGGKWDVNQWTGYTGGDGQNKGSMGIGVGRRELGGPRMVGPRPPPPGR